MKAGILLSTALAALVLCTSASEDPTGALEGVQDLSKRVCIDYINIDYLTEALCSDDQSDLPFLQLLTPSTRSSMVASMRSLNFMLPGKSFIHAARKCLTSIIGASRPLVKYTETQEIHVCDNTGAVTASTSHRNTRSLEQQCRRTHC